MKKTTILVSAIALLFILPGCRKVIDFDWYVKHPDQAPPCPCKIKTMSFVDSYSPVQPVTATFSYNWRGDPVSILYPEGDQTTGRPDFLFNYDNKGRLTDYVQTYIHQSDSSFYEYWSHFYYSGDKIVLDTSYSYGTYVRSTGHGLKPPAEYGIGWENRYYYDAKGRIIRIDVKGILNDFSDYSNEYEYDSTGNRIYARFTESYAVNYDHFDKGVNIHRTSKVWMFLAREYSINSPFDAESYNAYKLPLKVNHAPSYFFLIGLEPPITVTYQCP